MNSEQTMTLENLPPDAREIIKSKKIRAKRRLSRWLVLLKILSKFDSNTDEAYKNASGKVISSVVVIFLSIFCTIFGAAFSDGNIIVLIIGGLIIIFGIIRAVIYGIKSFKLNKIDLDNDFRETVLPLLEYLSEDIPQKGKILLDLDMSEASGKQFQVSKTKLPPGKFNKLIETIYEINCCKASIPLVNGTVLMLDITKKLASYDRYYRSSRGKYKHKKKWKLLTLVTTSLTPGTDNLCFSESDVSSLSDSEKVKLTEKKGDRLCKLTRKFKFRDPEGGIPENCVPPEEVIAMYMKLCSTLESAI